jgi:hypothetical protein
MLTLKMLNRILEHRVLTVYKKKVLKLVSYGMRYQRKTEGPPQLPEDLIWYDYEDEWKLAFEQYLMGH